jgi:hypothetical protein
VIVLESVFRKEKQMKPWFNASEVAALIGEHPYKSRDVALVTSALPKHPLWREHIIAFKNAMRLETVDERERRLRRLPAVNKAIETAISAGVGATSETIEEAIALATTFAPEHASAVEKAIVTGIGKASEAEIITDYNIKREITIPVVETSVGKVDAKEYSIVGKFDHTDGEIVVEIKQRKHDKWKTTPLYDLIQLRVYMWMNGKGPGRLVERFPSNPTKETDLEWSEEEWDKLDAKLKAVSRYIYYLEIEEVNSLLMANLLKY